MSANSIAAINATILTILIGFVSAYAIFKQTRIQELENEIINQAEKINQTLNVVFIFLQI
jgi:hypothetical protein